MKKLLLCAVLACAALAQAGQFTAQVEAADCTVVAKSGSVTGAIVGSGVGAAAGGYIGKKLFGRAGGILGGLGGAVGGGLAGENVGSTETYSCVLQVRSPKGEILYARTLSTYRYTIGQTIKVYQDTNGVIAQ